MTKYNPRKSTHWNARNGWFGPHLHLPSTLIGMNGQMRAAISLLNGVLTSDGLRHSKESFLSLYGMPVLEFLRSLRTVTVLLTHGAPDTRTIQLVKLSDAWEDYENSQQQLLSKNSTRLSRRSAKRVRTGKKSKAPSPLDLERTTSLIRKANKPRRKRRMSAKHSPSCQPS